MNIVMVAPVFWPATFFGGPVYSLTALAKALVANGHAVTVLTGNLGNEGKLNINVGQETYLDGIRIIYLDQESRPPYGRLSGLEKALDRVSVNADILHISSTLTNTTWQALKWAKANRFRYVITTRGHLIRQNLLKDIKKWIAMQIFLKTHLMGAAFLQATSEYEADELRAWGFTNVLVIPHGIELPAVFPKPKEARLDWKLPPTAPVLIYLGRLHKSKGIEVAIEATASLIGHHSKTILMVAGAGPLSYLQYLKKLSNKLGITERCNFVGQVTGAKKWSLLRAGDIYIQLSKAESFGLSIGEAIGAGMPAIIGEKCGWEDAEAMGYVTRTPRDVEKVALILNEHLMTGAVKSDRDELTSWIRRQYSWINVAKSMASAYDWALSKA